MQTFKTICLLSVNLFLACGCATVFKGLTPVQSDGQGCLEKFIPPFQTQWYEADVEITGNRITGLLLVKAYPGNKTRIVFTNEPGIKFFDVEFSDQGFTVHYILKKMDKKPVRYALEKDFGMLLVKPLMTGEPRQFMGKDGLYHAFLEKKETNFFVTDKDCASLLRIEKSSKRKKKAEIRFQGQGIPERVDIDHFLFDFHIHLKKLNK